MSITKLPQTTEVSTKNTNVVTEYSENICTVPSNQLKITLKEKIVRISVELYNLKLPKSGRNDFLKTKRGAFKYYELADFLPQLTALCLKYLIFYSVDIGKNKATLTVKDCESEEYETVTHEFHFDMQNITGNPIQTEGGISTYMRRYLLMNMFGIVEPDTFDNTSYTETYHNEQLYLQIANGAKEKIDKLENAEKITMDDCRNIYKFFNDRGITKQNKNCNPNIALQFERLVHLWKRIDNYREEKK